MSVIKLVCTLYILNNNYSAVSGAVGLYECLLFNTGSLLLRGEAISVGEEGVEGARVAQVATILSNLSGDEASARMLAGHPGVLR